MAKQIKDFVFEVPSVGTACFVRYNINDSIATELVKYGEFSWEFDWGRTILQEMTAITAEIKTREGIS